MSILLKNNPEDSTALGIQRNLALFPFFYIVGVIVLHFIMPGMEVSDAAGKAILMLILLFQFIPASLFLSGVVNSIILYAASYPEAARINIIIAFISFLVGGTCGITMLT